MQDGSTLAVVLAVGFFAFIGAVFVLSLGTTRRVTLRRDGTLELVRVVGTVRLSVDRIREVRSTRNVEDSGISLRLVTNDGTYRFQPRSRDALGLVDALCAVNPLIEARHR